EFTKRTRKLKTAGMPNKSYECPKTSNYEATTYTSGQLTPAFVKAANLANVKKMIGKNKYPHPYANHERLPFECGSNKWEFPLDRDSPGQVYSGGEVTTFPDRLIFEFRGAKTEGIAKFCGIIRH
ncbi:hypothetical protein BO78DRAFT_276482, partial [Aspergillus sclerotiicarbonarius CBS 121057]